MFRFILCIWVIVTFLIFRYKKGEKAIRILKKWFLPIFGLVLFVEIVFMVSTNSTEYFKYTPIVLASMGVYMWFLIIGKGLKISIEKFDDKHIEWVIYGTPKRNKDLEEEIKRREEELFKQQEEIKKDGLGLK